MVKIKWVELSLENKYNKEWLNFYHFSVYNPGIRRYNIESRVPA